MKPWLTLAALALMGFATAASAAQPTASGAIAGNVATACIPGMTAAAPGVCSLPGFHWSWTTVYDHPNDGQGRWMLLPDKSDM